MIAGLFALLASTTFIFTVSIIVLIAMAILLEFEREGWATTFFSLGIALVLWNFKSDIWGYISSNPSTAITFAVSYILIGIVWSFLKWRSYVKGIFNKFKTLKADFIKKNGPIIEGEKPSWPNFTDSIKNQFKYSDNSGYASFFNCNTYKQIAEKITPEAAKKKSVITSWISYWPVSLGGTLLNNPFRKFFEFLYENLSGFYDKITNKYKKDAFEGL